MQSLTERLSSLFLVPLLLLASGQVLADTPNQISGTTKVSAEEVIALVEELDDLVIIDARKSQDHSAGFIEGAVSLPDTETNPANLANIIPSKSTPVLFYCNGIKCGRSVTACKIAIADGYSKIYWFRGGWDEWVNKGLPVSL